MAHDILFGQTSRDWSTGSLPKGATGYVPDDWWTEAKAEAEVQRHMKGSGFLTPGLSRKDAEETVMDYMKAHKIGVMSGIGSLLIPDKQQKAFLSKIDDIRFDVRRVEPRSEEPRSSCPPRWACSASLRSTGPSSPRRASLPANPTDGTSPGDKGIPCPSTSSSKMPPRTGPAAPH